MGASLYDFRDLDLLLKLEAEGDSEGWVETERLANSLGFERAQKVATRLNWMRHYGMLEFDRDRRLWRLTDGAGRVIHARLKASQQRTLEALPDEAMVEVMSAVTQRWQVGNGMLADLLRREFLFGTQRR
jgi:hypothetical protein